MSDVPQDVPSAATAPLVAASPLHSTVSKKKHGPNLPYEIFPKSSDQVQEQLAREMNGRWLGAMPVETFLQRYLPIHDATLGRIPKVTKDLFKLPTTGTEVTYYDTFIEHASAWIPQLEAVNTSSSADTANNVDLKVDISIYKKAERMALQAMTNFFAMELWIEFKTSSRGEAFCDIHDGASEQERNSFKEQEKFTPNTKEGKRARGQLAHYAGVLHSHQFRHFSFSVSIHGEHARFFRWDTSGTVVTAAFNCREHPHLMAEFLWRFNHLSDEQRGHDMSVAQVDPKDNVAERVYDGLHIKDKTTPLLRFAIAGGISGEGHVYAPRLPTLDGSLVCRCTRSAVAYWIPSQRQDPGKGKVKFQPWSEEGCIHMKDTWRPLSDDVSTKFLAEHEIYEVLYANETPNIPQDVSGEDVEGGMTQTQALVDAEWLCVCPEISQRQHYRLLQRHVGRPLFMFRSTKELTTGVLNAVQAHWHAFHRANLLHRDVHPGNIILTDEGNGLLIDWEMAQAADDYDSRYLERTGMWPFMSANMMQHPGQLHMLSDDLESFLHILAWMMVRYLPATDTYSSEIRAEDMQKFDDFPGVWDRGGNIKACDLGSGRYPSVRFQPKEATPLWALIKELKTPFKSLYEEPLSASYEADMKRLDSSEWFMAVIEKALNEEPSSSSWPADDHSCLDLVIIREDQTPRQLVIRSGQEKWKHEVMEATVGLPNPGHHEGRLSACVKKKWANTKRYNPAASGPSKKRRHVVSGS